MKIEVIFSRDDNGWYCEVYDFTGCTLHTTAVYPDPRDAEDAAERWIANT